MRVVREQRGSLHRLRLFADGADGITVTTAGLRELRAGLAAAEEDPACRVVALDAPDGGFCRGMDLAAVATDDDEEREAGVRHYVDVLTALRHCSRVLVALVDGVALGAGVGLVATADLAVATRSSRLGLPEVLLGLAPAIVLATLRERMTVQNTRRLALSGATIAAEEARERGLIDEVVDSVADLEDHLRSAARQLRRADADAVAHVKSLCRMSPDLRHDEALEVGADLTIALLSSAKRRSQLRRFVDEGLFPSTAARRSS